MGMLVEKTFWLSDKKILTNYYDYNYGHIFCLVIFLV